MCVLCYKNCFYSFYQINKNWNCSKWISVFKCCLCFFFWCFLFSEIENIQREEKNTSFCYEILSRTDFKSVNILWSLPSRAHCQILLMYRLSARIPRHTTPMDGVTMKNRSNKQHPASKRHHTVAATDYRKENKVKKRKKEKEKPKRSDNTKHSVRTLLTVESLFDYCRYVLIVVVVHTGSEC